ncbi:unnamed protein product [Clonostachys rhizophaga]|uniref:Uncharacterized protein n=1 Tax=Clonostachys rhizophaga TaxID=160324 RepID=A0A9N9W1G9_9HYPO|nr:unnamed protein product [Clonostachys rhizophaga]
MSVSLALQIGVPAAWAASVKDFRLWRLMYQYRPVHVEDIVVPIVPAAGFNLTEFGTKNPPINQPIKKDLDFYATVRRRLKRAMITKNSPITKEIGITMRL